MELDGSKLEGRSIRVKRSVNKDTKQKAEGRRSAGKRPSNTPGRANGAARGGFQGKKFSGNQRTSTKSFKGEMVDPNKKTQKKSTKKKVKRKKAVHI